MGETSFSMSKSSGVDIVLEFDGPYSISISFDNRCGERKRICASEKDNGWNSLSKLPEYGQTVLCLDKWGVYHIAWQNGFGWTETSSTFPLYDIEWWMPLPNRPKGE